MAISHYQEYLSTWRSKEWLETYNKLSPAQVILNCIMERITPQYHLVENAEELSSHPLLCIEQQAHYYRMIANTGAERLRRLSLLGKETRALIRSLSSQRFNWLSNVPIDALVELRKNNENAEFRERLVKALSRLHDSALEETDRVAAEVCHEILALTGEHARRVKEIQSKYSRIHGKTAVAGWAAVAAMFIPSLAPFLGTMAPFALATKYTWDKIGEVAKKKKLSKSLMGVLSLTKTQSE